MKAENSNINRIPYQNSVSFKGYASSKCEMGTEFLKFYSPVYKMPKNCKMYLELCSVKRETVYKDGRKNIVWVPDNSISPMIVDDSDRDFEIDSVVRIPRNWDDLNKFFPDDNHAMGYRFVVKNESGNVVDYVNDMSGTKTECDSNTYNVITKNQSVPVLSGPIYHMFFNSFAPEKTTKTDMPNRNHFNEADTTLKSVQKKLEEGVLDPYKLILSTPVFGKDELSSHGYWTANPYQINSKIGTKDDFMDLQCNLFDKGKAWIADGAFTSQGYQSPLVANVLKYGDQSPFKNWLKIDSKPTLGVLPDKGQTGEETFKHIRYKLVNSPSERNKYYQSDKPTYIQFYDDRLVSDEQIESNSLIDRYAKQVPEIGDTGIVDPYAISTHQDSVQHYAFEISPSDRAKIEDLENNKNKPLSEIEENLGDLFEFKNFSVSSKNDVKGAECWDGQVDLIKMNLSGCGISKESQAGMVQARNYLYGCATYWTKATNDALVEHIAKMLSGNQSDTIRKISNSFDISPSDIDTMKDNIKNGYYNFNILNSSLGYNENDSLNDFILNEIVNYPLESIELPTELTGIIASPYVSARPTQLEYQNIEKLDMVKGDYPDKNDSIYKEYATINSGMNNLYMNGIYDFVKNVLSSMTTPEPIFEDDGNNLTDYGKFVARLVVPDIVKFGVVNSLYGNSEVRIENDKINYNLKGLQNESIGFINQDSPISEADSFIKQLKKGFSSDKLIEQTKNLSSALSKRFEKLSLDDLKLAQALIDESGAGLNWRFDAAKDIADNNQLYNDNNEYHNILDESVDFWKNFVSNIKKENSNSYTIGEMTDLYHFIEGRYSGANGNTDMINENAGRYSNDKVAERVFIEDTGMTTLTNYTYMYASLPSLLSINPDDMGIYNYGNMGALLGKLKDFLKVGPLSMANYSHVATGNHDKPRAMHAMALDMNIFNFDNQKEHNKDAVKNFVKTIAYVMDKNVEDVDYNNYSSFAIATAAKFKETLWENGSFKFKKEYSGLLNEALKDIAQGKYIGQNEPDLRRAAAFGNDDFRASLANIVDYAIYKAENSGKKDEAKLLKEDKQDIINKTVAKILDKPIKEELRIWQLMNAISGNPTLYAGDEYAQTGFETPSKNVYVKNRGIVNHGILKEDGNDKIKAYNKHLKAIAQIHNIDGLSALSGGTMSQIFGVWCGPTWPDGPFSSCFVHNDDKGSTTFTVITPFFDKLEKKEDIEANEGRTIPTRDNDNLKRTPKESEKIELYNLDGSFDSNLDKSITKGMKLKRVIYNEALGKYEPDNKNYVIDFENGKYYIKSEDGSPILIDELASYFYKA